MTARSARSRPVVSVVAVLVVVLLSIWLAGRATGGGDGPAHSQGTTTTQQRDAARQGSSGLATIAYDALPPEARDTIRLIDRGGPYPYHQDDGTFQNREGILPQESGGFYREYTVVTPGSDDRGARRIIGARDGTLYYTDDHYESFRQVLR